MKRKILITGVAGMMGSHCADYLVKHYGNYFDIYGVDDLSGGYKENINSEIIFSKIDLRKPHKTARYFNRHFKKTGLDYLIHFVSAAHEIRSFFTPIENMSRNDEAFRNTLTYAIKYGVKHISFFSSMSRYGDGVIKNGDKEIVEIQQVPFKESYIPAPADPYACSKVHSENMLKAFQKVYNYDYTIWVPHNCFSPRQFIDPYRNFIAIWMNLILAGKHCIIYGTGEQKRALSWVNDFNPTICESLFNRLTFNQVINIGGDEYKTINEWYDLVRKITEWEKDAIYIDKRPGEVLNAYCDHEKAKHLSKFNNNTSIEDALKEMWEYFKKKGHRKFKYINKFEIESNLIPETWKKRLF